MLKYRVGGANVGSIPQKPIGDTQGVNNDFAKLLEQRQAMDTTLYREPTKTREDSNHLRECLVKKEEPNLQRIENKQTQRKKDIEFILENPE